jgi:hypothetical protein
MAWSALQASISALCLVLVAILVPAHGHAEIYKWVDENGVVNYAEHPPSRGRVQVVAPERTPLTIYTAPESSGTAETTRQSDLGERVEQLERQIVRERQERERGAALAAEREARRSERCYRERVVNCEEEIWDGAYPTAVIYQRNPWWQHRRPSIRPHSSHVPRESEPEPHRMLRRPRGPR